MKYDDDGRTYDIWSDPGPPRTNVTSCHGTHCPSRRIHLSSPHCIDFDQSTEYSTSNVRLTLIWRGHATGSALIDHHSAPLSLSEPPLASEGCTRPAIVCPEPSVVFIDTQYFLTCHVFFPTFRLSPLSYRRNRPRCSRRDLQTAEVLYASFSYACQLTSKFGPRATVHILHRSTSSTMNRYLIYFISIGRLLK